MNSKRFAAALLIAALFAAMSFSNLFSQDMQPPKPVENKSADAMVGEWTGETTSMGMNFNTDLTIRWGLNHQFLIVNINSVNKDNSAVKYSGMGIYGIDEKGSLKNWWFDDWGVNGTSMGNGSISGNKLQVVAGNDYYSETRTFEVNGNEGKMNAKGSYTVNGQKIPFEETASFHKK